METIIGWIIGSIAGFGFLILMIQLFLAMHDEHKTVERIRERNEQYAKRFGLDDED